MEVVMENDKTSATDKITFAVFDGEKEITDAMYEEVKKFAAYVRQREGNDQ